MILPILAFIFATVGVAQLSYLPSWQLVMLVMPFVYLALRPWRTSIALAFCLGLIFSYASAFLNLQQRLPETGSAAVNLDEPIWLEGTVSSLPQYKKRGMTFRFDVSRPAHLGSVTLSSYYADGFTQPKVGEKWRLLTKLLRPRGLVNTALFDYDGWLLSKGIDATGYVRSHVENQRLEVAGHRFLHHQLRDKLRRQVTKHLEPSAERGLLIALLIGENNQIDAETWQVLSDTGTNHLMIISGLHVGLVAALSLYLFKGFFRLIRIRNRHLPLVLSMMLTLAYGSLAGFGLPVQRALVMALIALFAVTLKRQINMLMLFVYAMLFVLCLNPLAVLGAGFWLSFGAVLILIYGYSGRVKGRAGISFKLEDWLRAQWLIWASSAPLLLCWVNQWSFSGFLVNLFAIPVVAMTIVPLLLLSVPLLLFDMPGVDLLLSLIEQSLTWLLEILRYFADLKLVVYRVNELSWPFVVALLGAYILLSPAALRIRWLGLVLFVPLFEPISEFADDPVARGDYKLTVLDVGQGLAIMINTTKHLVVFDAGPAYGGRFDAGKQILVPSIRMSGKKRVDVFILSHGDIDHAGGADALLSELPVLQRYSSGGNDFSPCRRGQVFHYDGVRFELLAGSLGKSGNNRSCVLRVEGHGISTLIPGDIEHEGEAALRNAGLIPADIIIAPHHGSASSSSPGFLNTINAHTVVVSAGYRNRFKHPHGIVTRRYTARHMTQYNTAIDGRIDVLVTRDGIDISRARYRHSRFWY